MERSSYSRWPLLLLQISPAIFFAALLALSYCAYRARSPAFPSADDG